MIKTMLSILACLVIGLICLVVVAVAAGIIYGIIMSVKNSKEEEANHGTPISEEP